MSSSPQKEVLISEPFPCPQCGEIQMRRTVESCKLEEGLTIRKLAHFKCTYCGERFFDDEAVHRIQAARKARATTLRSS